MELLRRSAFIKKYAHLLEDEPFVLVDVGCSGGIDHTFRCFGPSLRAYAFDPDVSECNRLAQNEHYPGVHYISAFVRGREEQQAVASHPTRNAWPRLSSSASARIRKRDSQRRRREWADPDRPVVLPDFFEQQGVGEIDFIKIDIDGLDFEVLQSLEQTLVTHRVWGVGAEVNFYGSQSPHEHTFHNTDRFMRTQCFELLGLSVRQYSLAALPCRYTLDMPAQTHTGRPMQGDALYLRDPVAGLVPQMVEAASPRKLLKLACLFAMGNLPDHAAELLQHHRLRFAEILDVDEAIESLMPEVEIDGRPVSYAQYMQLFEQDHEHFYPRRALDRERKKRRAGTAVAQL